MLSRKIHRLLGLTMLLPMIAWAATGFIFFIKPGYGGAYEALKLKRYPLEQSILIPHGQQWEDLRIVRSVLGLHFLVTNANEAVNINGESMKAWQPPTRSQVKMLLEDAISQNPHRYGVIETIDGSTAYTSTGIKLSLNWDDLTFVQEGFDRRLISLLYKIHYLQWTPWPVVNQVLGIVGLVLLISLTVLGLFLVLAKKPEPVQ